ncbi:MAG: DNA cytosine methyltransferase [Pseudomonadota bacterium]
MMLRVIDLFSGAGGMSLGYEDPRFCGGYEIILSIDNDPSAVETHKANFGGEAVCANIEDWLAENDVPEADVVIGGPPCQGFSLLNKKRAGDERRALWEPFIDIAHLSGASVFVMENVAELYRSPELNHIKAKAADYGFSCQASIVNSADYGAPQKRMRTIVVGQRLGTSDVSFPPLPSHAAPDAESNLPKWRTVRDAIADLPAPIKTQIEGLAPLDLHIKRNPTAKSVARYKVVPPGGNRFDLQRNAPELTPQCWINKKSGGTDLFGRLWWDRPSVTIRTEFFKPEKGRYLHPDQHRPITHREAARLMGFPDDFSFKGPKIEIARQIGNAVPPPLAGALARMVLEMVVPFKQTA